MIRPTTLLILFFAPFTALCDAIDNSASAIDFVKLEAYTSTNVIHFKWEVNSEINGETFFIEKSLNGSEWSEFEEMASIGDHTSPHIYRTSEINSTEGALEHFRIIRVDKFGTSSVMDQIEVKHTTLMNLCLIPSLKTSKKEVIVSYSSLIPTKGVLKILNQNDLVVEEVKVRIEKGYNRLVVNTKKYVKEMYTFVLVDLKGNVLEKIYEHGKKQGRTKF